MTVGNGIGTDNNQLPKARLYLNRIATNRFTWAAASVFLLLILLLVFGPDKEDVDKRFEYYGAQGELHIMPNISVDQGVSPVHKVPKSLQSPSPAISVQRTPEETPDDGIREIPKETNEDKNIDRLVTEVPVVVAEDAQKEQVEMLMPQFTSSDLYLINFVHPEYPMGATEEERRTLGLYVTVGIYVNHEGLVTDILINDTNASRVFIDETVSKIKLWKFGWRKEPEIGRWVPIQANFKSPYRHQAQQQDGPLPGN